MDGLLQFRADHHENTINPGCDIMTNRSWLKQEIPQWVKEDVISEDAGKKILSRYKKKDGAAYKEAFFILAVVCIIGGIFFLCASLWNGLDQDQRFLLALAPLAVSFLLVTAVFLADHGGVPLGKSRQKALTGEREKEEAEDSSVPKPVRRTASVHRVPVFIREAAGTFHGICLIGAFWMVGDSFKLSSDLYTALALCAFLLLILTAVTESAGMGIIYMIVSVGIFYSAPVRGWPEAASWIYMFLALGFLGHLLRSHRDRAVICFSWVWAVGVLLLIFWSAGNMLWQTLFFSLAAALTWMAGGLFREYGLGAEALRFFGGIAVFAVLLEGSYGTVWADISGSYALWFIFLLFLAADGVLLFRIALKKEWLSVLAGLTPFVMALSAIISIFETSGALPAIIVSVYAGILAGGVILRGYLMDRPVQSWAGIFLLAGDGAIRVIDSALSFTQRGLFFLGIGIAAAVICYILYLPGRQKGKAGRREKDSRREEASR
ncbi:DUF2157 domain-containing protein [Dialister sp.]|uniref:DUF2157 domain-containing protein n=1 Tax=Dialister sp. TaxID=1955814 RepID=UPI003F0ABCBB